MANNKVARRAHTRARALQGGAVAASAIAALAVAPAAGAHEHAHWGGYGHDQNSRLVPDSVVISGTVFPRSGVKLTVGDTLPYATNYGSTVPEPAPVLAQAAPTTNPVTQSDPP